MPRTVLFLQDRQGLPKNTVTLLDLPVSGEQVSQSALDECYLVASRTIDRGCIGNALLIEASCNLWLLLDVNASANEASQLA
jgi:hypothetical protein